MGCWCRWQQELALRRTGWRPYLRWWERRKQTGSCWACPQPQRTDCRSWWRGCVHTTSTHRPQNARHSRRSNYVVCAVLPLASAKVDSRDDWMIKCSRDSKSQPGARIWARASVPTLVTDVEHDLDDELPGVSAPGPCQREASGDVSRRAAESMRNQRGHV